MFFPGSNPYTMLENSIGYVIVRKREESGILFEEQTILIQDEINFIIFDNWDTEFIIEKLSKPFGIKKIDSIL